MNITLDSQLSATTPASTEYTATTTYKPSGSAQAVRGGGYKLDIADKVMDNEAYNGHGLTADDIMQQAANSNVSVQKDFMVVMSNSVSGEDLQKMQEDGFKPGSTDVETYVNIVDKIKVTLAQAGVEIEGYNDDLDVEQVEEITGSRVNANDLVRDLSQKLCESDIPVTNENVSELVKAIMKGSGITQISDDAIKYMVVNHKAPTIDNIYRAQFSSAGNIRQSQGYYSEVIVNSGRASDGGYGKYYAKKADSINWDNLKGQMEAVVRQASLDTDEQTKNQALENAKWLVESGIELNVENLTLVSDLRNIQLPMNQQALEQMCVTAMENGKAPAKALMTGEISIAEQAKEIVEAAADISDEAVHDVVESGEELNIKNLSAAQRNIDAQNSDDAVGIKADKINYITDNAAVETSVDEASLKEIEARRQLEEIRLMMTEEAGRHLIKSGLSIDTTELSKLVDALKAAEEMFREVLFKGGSAEENEQRAIIFEETLTKTKTISGMPAAVVGRLVMSSQSYTLNRIHAEGEELQNRMQEDNSQNPNHERQKQASQAYETLMTEPRKDLGDKISKAFRNVDDILEDMNLETSDANRRAVRILGYNSMDITEENINAVKEADSRITGVISRMTPAATLQMIREQKNPLEMTIEELDEYLNIQDNDLGAAAEKYSKFLQKLDRSNAISESEREAYIGIYRLFRQIEKSDGAVIGSVVATGAEMNFKNMLSAIRTTADKNMDIKVDDNFGGLEELISKGKAIDEQIMAGFNENQSSGADNPQQRERELYYARLSGEINTELAEKTDIDKLGSADISAETTIEQFADNIKMTQMSEDAEKQAMQKKENLKDFQRSLQEAAQIDERAVEALIEYGQTVSVDNMQAAAMLMFDRGSLFKQIIGKSIDKDESVSEADENDVQEDEAVSDILSKADSFVQKLTHSSKVQEAYKEIIDEAGKAVENMIYKDGASYIDVKAAKILYKGLSLAGNFAREENYEVPMNIKGEITSVNLKICHNTVKSGKVSVTFETDTLGKVAAEFEVTKNRISGMVVYDNKSEKADMEQIEKVIKEELSSEGGRQVDINLVYSKSLDLNKFGQDRETGSTDEVLTSDLYRTAKAFLTAIKN